MNQPKTQQLSLQTTQLHTTKWHTRSGAGFTWVWPFYPQLIESLTPVHILTSNPVAHSCVYHSCIHCLAMFPSCTSKPQLMAIFSDSIYKPPNCVCIWHVQILTCGTLSTWHPSYWSLCLINCQTPKLWIPRTSASPFTLCSHLTDYSENLQPHIYWIQSLHKKSWTELIGRHSTWAEANVWTPPNSKLWLSGAVHTL